MEKDNGKRLIRKGDFADPEFRKIAEAKRKGLKRPGRKSRKTIIHEAKVEIAKEELLRNGYLEALRPHMPKIMEAHFKVASMSKVGATPERKLLFETSGLKQNKAAEDVAESIGSIIAELTDS